MEKKIPLRRCIGCSEMKDKRELIRVVRTTEGEITIDFKGKTNGRGAYVCKNKACLEKACKSKSLERAFNIKIPLEVYDSLMKESEAFE
ncbi:MAG: YlxR family protein [Lachnospiraceae bacterium]|nr:YlxR family protein [Lachnospiraceae bacterium]